MLMTQFFVLSKNQKYLLFAFLQVLYILIFIFFKFIAYTVGSTALEYTTECSYSITIIFTYYVHCPWPTVCKYSTAENMFQAPGYYGLQYVGTGTVPAENLFKYYYSLQYVP
jgi:hypothetical protein